MNTVRSAKALSFFFAAAVSCASQAAMAGWDPGRCPVIPNAGGVAPCIEHEVGGVWWHIGTGGGHAGVWHGQGPSTPFTFCGASSLAFWTESGIPVNYSCSICMDAYVKAFKESGDWRIGIKVTGASFSPGDAACRNIDLEGFPWYIADAAVHQGFGNATGIPYIGSQLYTGNVGEIQVTYLNVPVVNGAHAHGVDFDNNGVSNTPSEFRLGFNASSGDPVVYEGGSADTPSILTLSATLSLQSPVQDVNIW